MRGAVAATMEPAPFYAEDLAFIHEAGFSDLAAAAARHIEGEVPPPARMADLGCGGGTLLDHLTARGYQGWGLDLSPSMVALARRRTPKARFAVGSVYDAALPPSEVVTCIGEVLNYDTGPGHHERVRALFHRVRGALRPGGLFLFDVATTERPEGTSNSARSGRDWGVSASAVTQGNVLVRTIHAWRVVGGRRRESREVHRVRLLDPAWVMNALDAAGFSTGRLAGYDDHAFQDGWDGFAARARA